MEHIHIQHATWQLYGREETMQYIELYINVIYIYR